MRVHFAAVRESENGPQPLRFEANAMAAMRGRPDAKPPLRRPLFLALHDGLPGELRERH